MKKLFIAILLIASTNAFANLNATVSNTGISWPNTGGWMQVQNVNTFQTECDGFISSCAVLPGTYHIIDHSNSIRQDFVNVSNGAASPAQTTQAVTVSESCSFNGAAQYFNVAVCSASCPAGMTIKRLRTCKADKSANGGSFLATDIQSDDTSASCRADGANFLMIVQVEIDCE